MTVCDCVIGRNISHQQENEFHNWAKRHLGLASFITSFEIINLFPNKPLFLGICSTNILKTLREKEKFLITSNFSFSHSVFFPFGEHHTILIKFEIDVCKLFQFGRV